MVRCNINLEEVNCVNNNVTAVRYFDRDLISLIVGILICFLASLCYNTYIKYSDKKTDKKIFEEFKNNLKENNKTINGFVNKPIRKAFC